mmetsp:Transcript_5115/g.12876  ORF Transcript_5115/g.12876 Transcript_5115/m.12876 type:complete len:253 (+) Transcript_5115:2061-2819(+)
MYLKYSSSNASTVMPNGDSVSNTASRSSNEPRDTTSTQALVMSGRTGTGRGLKLSQEESIPFMNIISSPGLTTASTGSHLHVLHATFSSPTTVASGKKNLRSLYLTPVSSGKHFTICCPLPMKSHCAAVMNPLTGRCARPANLMLFKLYVDRGMTNSEQACRSSWAEAPVLSSTTIIPRTAASSLENISSRNTAVLSACASASWAARDASLTMMVLLAVLAATISRYSGIIGGPWRKMILEPWRSTSGTTLS